jgi:hypothetical protein
MVLFLDHPTGMWSHLAQCHLVRIPDLGLCPANHTIRAPSTQQSAVKGHSSKSESSGGWLLPYISDGGIRSSHFSSLARHSGRVQENWLVRAAKKLGNGRIGWHAFRHSHSTLLRPLGVDLKVQRELLQHADIRATMNIYTRAVRSALREANSKVVRLVISAQGDRGRKGSSVNAPSSSLGFFQVQENQEDIGRGGGDRTHDLRLKRPLLYH